MNFLWELLNWLCKQVIADEQKGHKNAGALDRSEGIRKEISWGNASQTVSNLDYSYEDKRLTNVSTILTRQVEGEGKLDYTFLGSGVHFCAGPGIE